MTTSQKNYRSDKNLSKEIVVNPMQLRSLVGTFRENPVEVSSKKEGDDTWYKRGFLKSQQKYASTNVASDTPSTTKQD